LETDRGIFDPELKMRIKQLGCMVLVSIKHILIDQK